MTNLTGKLFIGVGGQYWLDKPKPGDTVYRFEDGRFIKLERMTS